LPFSILCDTERRVVRDWGIYNARERGGIAKPAVFLIQPDLLVRYASVDTVAKRVPASAIVSLLKHVDPALEGAGSGQMVRRRVYIPGWRDWISGIRNSFRR